MKIMRKIFLVVTFVMTACLSCTKDGADLLDPTASRGISDVFGNATNSDKFLMDIYRQILPVLPRTDFAGSRWRHNYLLDVGTENGSSNIQGNLPVRDYNAGSLTPSSTGLFSYSDWRDGYVAIRACYLFLAHIDEVPLDPQFNYDETTRKIRKAEAKWLLAFNYAELAKEFGGLPLIKKVVDPLDDVTVARSSFDETINYVVQLCDEAAVDLPPVYTDNELGRATRGAALALKARMLLYAASPLWNDSSSPADSPFNGKYDAGKWLKAAQAAQAVMNLNAYQLHQDIATMFNTRTNSEIIYARMQEPMAYFSATNVPYRLYNGTGAYALGGANQVTYNMVKEYEVLKNGVAYSVDDPASGHNLQDPYKNRDPRFYRDCIYNGAQILGKTAEFGDVAAGVAKTPAHNMLASIYNTYVFNVKFCDLTLNVTWNARSPSAGTRTNQNYPYLRYAEILLNYAEAMNEVYGPEGIGPGLTRTALDALNEVRTRAKYPAGKPEYMGLSGGMPPLASGLGKDEFRQKLRHERRVEFCFEEHWFWDLRRWKLTPDLDIKAQIPVWVSPTAVQYQIKTIDNRYFDPKMYRMPIPQAEIQANPKLVQNPDW